MKIKTSTYVRMIINILAAVNAILTMAGKPIIRLSDDTVEIVVNAIITVVVWANAFWKNNSYTHAAIEGDMVKDRLKKAEG